MTTPEPGRSAKDTFLVSSKDGSALTEALVNDIKAAILATVCKGKGTAAAPKARAACAPGPAAARARLRSPEPPPRPAPRLC